MIKEMGCVEISTEGNIATFTFNRATIRGEKDEGLLGMFVGHIGRDGKRFDVLVDVSPVTSIDSAAIAKLVILRKKAIESGGKLAMFGMQESVRRRFESMSLQKMFVIVQNREEALAHVRGT